MHNGQLLLIEIDEPSCTATCDIRRSSASRLRRGLFLRDWVSPMLRVVWTVLFSVGILATCTLDLAAQTKKTDKKIQYRTIANLGYRSGDGLTEYMKERCRLDVYYPHGIKDYPTVVWFHGGGLKNGNKSVPEQLKEQGLCVVAVNYRKHPKVKSPEYIRDAAASVAWTLKNIERYGGSRDQVFVSGHSAGGYLTSMVGMDKSYLAEFDIDADELAGLIPFSGHTITHFTIRSERGIDGKQPVLDHMAPLFHVRKDSPPMLLITGDRELELLGRYEENAYFWRMMQVVGHPNTTIKELDGFNHGQMAHPAHSLLIRFVKQIAKQRKSKKRETKSKLKSKTKTSAQLSP